MNEKITSEEWLAELDRFEEQSKENKWGLTELEHRRLKYRIDGLTIPEIAAKEGVALRSVAGTFKNIKHKAKMIKMKGE